MTDAETIASLRAELARVTADCAAMRDALHVATTPRPEDRQTVLKALATGSGTRLLAELARVTAERDDLKAEVDAMDRCIAELAVATASETLCEGCQSEADEEMPPC